MRSPAWLARSMVLAAAIVVFTPTAHAQEGETPPARYQELVDRALAESAAGRWEEARAAFREAHELFPNARTLRGIGVVAFEIRDYVDAVRNLRLALAETRRALTPEQRREVEELLGRSLALVARYDASSLPPDAVIVVDGQTVTPEADGELLVAVGEHSLEVRAQGDTARARLRIRGGEREPILWDEPASAPRTASPAPAATEHEAPMPAPTSLAGESPAPSQDTAGVSPSEPGSNVGPIATLIGGGVLLVAGSILFLLGNADLNDVEDARPGTAWSSLEVEHDRAPVLTGLGLGLGATGAALGIAGGVWLSTSSSDDAARTGRSSRAFVAGTRFAW